MLIQPKFQSLIRGQGADLTNQELTDFENYCAEESILPDQFCKIAVQLYKSNSEQAYHFLHFIASVVIVKEKYNNSYYNEAKTTMYNYISVLCLGKAIRGPQSDAFKQNFLLLSQSYLLKAENIYTKIPYQVLLARALINLHNGDVQKCLKSFHEMETELENHMNSARLLTIIQLMMAQCYFSKKNYEKSLELYRRCFMRNNCLPIKGRIGMAYCYFHTNRFEMAKVCAQRALQLDPRCVDALILLAIVHERMEDYVRYLDFLKLAYQINKEQPLLLYLLAEHFLLKSQVQTAEQLCHRGLESISKFSRPVNNCEGIRNDYLQIQSRFINILGQIEHKKKNFQKAIEFYSKVAQKDMLWNDISLVQCLIGIQSYKEALERMEYTYRIYEKEKKDCRFLKDTYRMMAYLKNKYKKGIQDTSKDSIYYYNEAIKFDKNDPDLKQELSYLLTIVDVDKHKALRTMQDLEKLQQANNIEPKPETIMNIGVLLMQNHEPEEGQVKLKRAIEKIEGWEDFDKNQQKGFMIIANYNYAICLENGNMNHRAIEVYDKNLEINPCHLNSLLRKSYVLQKIGDNQNALKTLAKAEQTFQRSPLTRVNIEKIEAMKAYLLYLEGRHNESLSILTNIMVNKPNHIYYKVLEFAIQYQIITRNETKPEQISQFLLSWKAYFQQVYQKNLSQLFCCLIVVLISASLNSLPKVQGTAIFKKILVSANKIPSIRYNMGLYYMELHDEDAAISCFNQHRQSTQSNKAEELIAHQYLINKDYKKCLKITKRNIMLDPANLQYRAQLIYATEARCEAEFSGANKRIIQQNYYQTRTCYKFQQFFATIKLESLKDQRQKHIKGIIKRVSSQKISNSKNLMEKYDNKAKPFLEQEKPKGTKTSNESGSESETEQDKRHRQMEQKRKRALAISKVKTQNLEESWNLIVEKQKATEIEKTSKRKTPKIDSQEGEAKKREKPKDKKEDTGMTEAQEYYSVTSAKKQKLSRPVLKKESILTS